MTTTLTLIESARWGDRYSCSNCNKELLIGGGDKPSYCYHCGWEVGKIDERTYYGQCHGCIHGDHNYDDPCLKVTSGECVEYCCYQSADITNTANACNTSGEHSTLTLIDLLPHERFNLQNIVIKVAERYDLQPSKALSGIFISYLYPEQGLIKFIGEPVRSILNGITESFIPKIKLCVSCNKDSDCYLVHNDTGLKYPFCRTCVNAGLYNTRIFKVKDVDIIDSNR